MTVSHRSPELVDPGLVAVVTSPHDRVLASLDADSSSLEAVAWAATHLAAVDRVLYPAAARALPGGPRRVREQLRCDRRLHRALWHLDRRLTGDMSTAAESVGMVEAEVRVALRQHETCEGAMVAELERLLDPDAQRDLVQRLNHAVLAAPTRAHPDTPHTRLTGGLLFRLDALLDRWRDLMDNRPVPTPRSSRPALTPGRWGSYLMALPYPPPERTGQSPPPRQPVTAASGDGPGGARSGS